MDVPFAIRETAEWQENVVSRQQLLQVGITAETIRHRLARGSWQQLYRGVYALFTGMPTRSQQLWAAVLRAGPGAALSHHTAAELHRLMKPELERVHVTIPATRRVAKLEGRPRIIVHISQRIAAAIQPCRDPARTTLEETVLDLTQLADTVDDVVGWITRGISSRTTTEDLLRKALETRKKARWRVELDDILHAARNGVHSPLEYRYYRDVERAHGLPAAHRQVKVTLEGKTAYRDAYYEEYRVVVELDGLEFHPSHNRPKDRHRDVVSTVEGIQTCRYGWVEVAGQPCETALWQARVLRQRGWKGTPVACGPGCPVGRAFRQAALRGVG